MEDLDEKLNQLLRFAVQLLRDEPHAHFMICIGRGPVTRVAGCCKGDQEVFIEHIQTPPVETTFVKPGDLEGN